MKAKIGVVSLGCDKNRVDTEVMLANLVRGGYEITPNPQDADVIIVNTCAFLESARKEAIETAIEMSQYKQGGKCKKVIITGCLGQKFGKEVFDGMSEVDAVAGAYEYDNICQIVEETLNGGRKLYNSCNNGLTFGSRILTTAPHTAYLKIADGCNNFCTYCLIPYIRGRYRSVPLENLLEQARTLAQGGVKELILVAQDTTRYGVDLYGAPKLLQLTDKLSQIDGIQWIRLLYCYPEMLTDELIDSVAANPKIVKYLDIPLQHINDDILRKMNRRSDGASVRALYGKLQARAIAVRSTFICGFPGETSQTVSELEDFIQKYPMRNAGFFAYSREEGTAAAKFDGQVRANTKQKYVKQLYKTQYQVAKRLNAADIGKTYKCIVDSYDGFDGEYYSYRGRTEFMTPEIDGNVYIASRGKLHAGDFCNVRITSFADYDLLGEVVE